MTGLLAVQAAAIASELETTPTTLITATSVTEVAWTTINMALPYPYEDPSISIAPEATRTAVLGMYYANPCGGGTEFASTTTVNLPVDCHGASAVSTSVRWGRCPLGGRKPPNIVDTVTSTPFTSFGYTCLPTPAPASLSSYNVADVTHTLPVPTLLPDQKPAQTPTALEVVHHPDGECRVNLGLQPTEGGDRGTWVVKECSSSALHRVTYARTVTSTIEFSFEWTPTETVPAATPSVKWVYDCK
ncbi:hypothetical protein B0H66DRAFT_618727 [Apodospora peruviana]|uniref:Uncharacterized protein n=1 Tax=Apodospora peruviana TaxID=516989 RepID=A0AAE0IAS4_9PEZI|nr:hypothetical protein B0H66DRAFT_618727 [Apodospora peruviana]